MTLTKKQKILIGVGAAAVIAAGAAWWVETHPKVPKGFAYGNGRIEATTVGIVPKFSARIGEILAKEGDMVQKGQVLVKMDIRDLEAQLRQAKAEVDQQRHQKVAYAATVQQKQSDLVLAKKTYLRSKNLYVSGDIALKDLQQDEANYHSAQAQLESAKADVVKAEATIQAAIAKADEIQVNLNDSTLASPITGRVLYRANEPGEVVNAGTSILTVLDLTDVYMQFYLPTEQVGKVSIGAEGRILLDAMLDKPIPAKVSYVESRSQFTPKDVETQSERQKLMFRVKLSIDPELLKQHMEKVKTGLPGVGYIRLDQAAAWPAFLALSHGGSAR
ncbi:MAG TPA: HlyD family efflux transporter periplasmic adaptor subunit [Elusimicrobiota bacterium]|nr:HlyD family efflux transporter periplasmic adaptor subunit [Elusimicrobiota bacterium]